MNRILILFLAILSTSAQATGVDIPAAKNLTGGKSCLYSGSSAEVCAATAGTAPSGNVVGTSVTIKTSSGVNVTSGTQAYPIFGSASVPAGVWLPCLNIQIVDTGTATVNESDAIGFTTDSSATTWSDLDLTGITNSVTPSVILGGATLTATQIRWGAGSCFPPITVASPTTYYFKSINRVTSGTLTYNGFLTFTRVY